MTNVDASTAPYSLSVIEPSPLNRVAAQGAPGTTWQPNPSNPYDPSTHAVQTKYWVNVVGDSIRYFTINAAGTISSSGYYNANKLNIKVTSDEQQQTVKEYTDLLGHVILKRVLISGDSLQTYYIYDSLNLLRAVIQPEGTAILKNNNWVFIAGFSANWMFLYRYDERRRMVMKKVPGADSVNMLYDKWDRVVLTQDGNLRANHFWFFTKYDQLNRTVVTGQITDIRTLSAVQTDVTNSTGRFESVSTAATEGYTLNNSFPSSSSYTLTVFTTTHFDSYANLPSWSSGYNFVNEYGISPENSFLNGHVVATQIRILGTSNFNRSVTYYDEKYRTIQVTSDNAAGGKDRVTIIVSFDGKATSDYHNHTSRFFTTQLLTKQVHTYDHINRMLTLTHQIANQEVVTLNQSAYNELGRLLNKKIHQSPSHLNALQKLDYYFNIRGWLNSINRPLTAESGYEEADLFNVELHYPATTMSGAIAQYNGNIAEQIWKNGYDEAEQGYEFQYDAANRMNSSTYGSFNGSWSFAKKYNESSISYDRNGNIKTLSRSLGALNVIDSMGYKNYNGNQLGKVDDAVTGVTVAGFQDKDNGTGYDYTYDPNGNMISDYNKSISSITYNFLNLPQVVTITGKGTITYIYDAAGNKLQKTTVDQTVTPNKTTNYYYAGNFVYRNDTLEFISHPEGRLRPLRIDTTQAISITNLKYIYDYYIKDNLGSVRSVLTTEQQTDIYAATMETANAAKEDALFNNISATSTTKPVGFSNDNSNQKASKLNGAVNITGNKRVGPSIILKVMTGDTISISTYSWYTGAVQPAATGVSAIATELVPLLTAGVGGLNGGKTGTVPMTYSGPLLSSDIASLISTDSSSYVNTRPKAFLNWMVVGEDYTAANSSPNHVNAIQIPVCNTGDTLKQVVGPTNMVVRRNGWIYIYLSNESAQDVYFDNLVISLRHGPLVEQKDYFAFGLQNPALSTQAIKYQYKNNRYTYTGKEMQSMEFVDSSGLNDYDFGARFYDPILGRWGMIDPLASKARRWSPYVYCYNNPVGYIDLDGMEGYGQTDNMYGSPMNDSRNYTSGSLSVETANGGLSGGGSVEEKGGQKATSVSPNTTAGEPDPSGRNIASREGGDPSDLPSQQEIDDCKQCMLAPITVTHKAPPHLPFPYSWMPKPYGGIYYGLTSMLHGYDVHTWGGSNDPADEIGSKPNPKNEFLDITPEMLEVIELQGDIQTMGNTYRPSNAEIAIMLTKLGITAEPHQPGSINKTTSSQVEIHGPTHDDSVKFLNPGAIYYDANILHNIRRDNYGGGELTNLPAKDSMPRH